MNQKNAEQEEEIKNLNKEIKKLRYMCQNKVQEIEIFDEETINNLEKLDKLGDGEGGKVYKVFKKVPYILKVMKINDDNKENLKNFLDEYETIGMMNHPNILKAFGIFMSSEKKKPSILLDFCPFNLDFAIKKSQLTKVKILFSIYQIAEGMKYAHFQKVIHRNLKPTNILFADDGTIKITDFGITKLMSLEEQLVTRGVSSQKFMAPEIIKEEKDYDEKVDVYSFGVLIYFMISGGEMPAISIDDIFEGKLAEIPSSFTPFARNLINSCWNFNAKERPSFKMICDKIARNNYKLLDISNAELKDLQARIEQHKDKIPKYDE